MEYSFSKKEGKLEVGKPTEISESELPEIYGTKYTDPEADECIGWNIVILNEEHPQERRYFHIHVLAKYEYFLHLFRFSSGVKEISMPFHSDIVACFLWYLDEGSVDFSAAVQLYSIGEMYDIDDLRQKALKIYAKSEKYEFVYSIFSREFERGNTLMANFIAQKFAITSPSVTIQEPGITRATDEELVSMVAGAEKNASGLISLLLTFPDRYKRIIDLLSFSSEERDKDFLIWFMRRISDSERYTCPVDVSIEQLAKIAAYFSLSNKIPTFFSSKKKGEMWVGDSPQQEVSHRIKSFAVDPDGEIEEDDDEM